MGGIEIFNEWNNISVFEPEIFNSPCQLWVVLKKGKKNLFVIINDHVIIAARIAIH